eukprot:gene4520-5116_t
MQGVNDEKKAVDNIIAQFVDTIRNIVRDAVHEEFESFANSIDATKCKHGSIDYQDKMHAIFENLFRFFWRNGHAFNGVSVAAPEPCQSNKLNDSKLATKRRVVDSKPSSASCSPRRDGTLSALSEVNDDSWTEVDDISGASLEWFDDVTPRFDSMAAQSKVNCAVNDKEMGARNVQGNKTQGREDNCKQCDEHKSIGDDEPNGRKCNQAKSEISSEVDDVNNINKDVTVNKDDTSLPRKVLEVFAKHSNVSTDEVSAMQQDKTNSGDFSVSIQADMARDANENKDAIKHRTLLDSMHGFHVTAPKANQNKIDRHSSIYRRRSKIPRPIASCKGCKIFCLSNGGLDNQERKAPKRCRCYSADSSAVSTKRHQPSKRELQRSASFGPEKTALPPRMNTSMHEKGFENSFIYWENRASMERQYLEYKEEHKEFEAKVKSENEIGESCMCKNKNTRANYVLASKHSPHIPKRLHSNRQRESLANNLSQPMIENKPDLIPGVDCKIKANCPFKGASRAKYYQSGLATVSHKASKIPSDLIESSLDKIDNEIAWIEANAEQLGVDEVKRRHIQLDKALMVFEPNIKSIIANTEVLISGKYHEAEEIQIRVKNIASRWQLLKLRITTTIESELTVFDKKKARMSGHHIKVTVDKTVSDDPFATMVEKEPGVFVDPATLEGYQVAYQTTTTVVKVESNVEEKEFEETTEGRVKHVEHYVTESEIPVAVDPIAESQPEVPAELLAEMLAESMPEMPDYTADSRALPVSEMIMPSDVQPVEASPMFPVDESFVSESAPEAVDIDSSQSAPQFAMDASISPPLSPVKPSSPGVFDGTPSDSTSSMDEQDKSRRSGRRSRTGSRGSKGMKLPGILSCTRKQGNANSSSSEDEHDPRPKALHAQKEPKVNEVANAAINAKLQEIAMTLTWISTRRAILESSEFGYDLPTNERLLEENDQLHKEIHQFQREVDKTCNIEIREPPSEIVIKVQETQEAYAILMDMCLKKKRHLTILVHFMREATQELLWMSEKEENEVSRDWADKEIDLHQLEEYRKKWQEEFEDHEFTFKAVIQKGTDIINDKHPGSSAITAYIEVMRTQWKWLLELRKALDHHMNCLTVYLQFFHDAYKLEHWLTIRVNLLSSMFEGLEVTKETILAELITKLKGPVPPKVSKD